MSKRMRLRPGQLKIGQTLIWDVYDQSGNLLLRRGQEITRESQIDSLLQRGLFADIAGHAGSSGVSSLEDDANYDPFWLWDKAQGKLARLLRAPTAEAGFADKAMEISGLMHGLCERSPDMALAAIMLMEQKDYPVIHSMHVAVLADLTARRIHWDEGRRTTLCCAALTMNIAMIELQALLFEQSTPLTSDQRSLIESHPGRGETMLRAAGIRDEVWLRAVREHHESPDGKGYPAGLTTPSEEALLLRTADILSAKVSPRATRSPMPSTGAVRALFLQEGSGEGNPFSAAMIKEIGIYPPGTFVKLENGEVGVVQRRGGSANTPVVASLVTTQGMPRIQPVIRDTQTPGLGISAVMPRDDLMLRFNLNHLWKT
ncbi:MAG: phosphohydrolase [Burkholderiales bacterium]|nr:phosphohydrolase [Burkholderiales bacterium]